MTLCDASCLIALINSKDPAHQRCIETIPLLSDPLITTVPCLTEALYLVHQYGGWKAQAQIWSYLQEDLVTIRFQAESEIDRMRMLMEQYRDIPMDFGDASLVAAAEAIDERQVFTLDKDFFIYRLPNNQAFEVLPKIG